MIISDRRINGIIDRLDKTKADDLRNGDRSAINDAIDLIVTLNTILKRMEKRGA